MRIKRKVKTPRREPFYQHFGAIVARHRALQLITQTELAVKVKRPRAFISNIEGGWQRVFLADVPILATALGLQLDSFLKEIFNDQGK